MKFLTKNTDYAIRALISLANNPNNFLSIKTISEKENIPYQFLRRIFQTLNKNKFIESKEGVTGGVKISQNPKDIKIIDLIHVFQGDVELSNCLFRKKICNNRNDCVLKFEIQRIENIVNREFENLTIQILIDKING